MLEGRELLLQQIPTGAPIVLYGVCFFYFEGVTFALVCETLKVGLVLLIRYYILSRGDLCQILFPFPFSF